MRGARWAIRTADRVLGTWSVLVGLGLLPAAGAAAAIVGGWLTGNLIWWVVCALALSLATNLVLAALAYRSRGAVERFRQRVLKALEDLPTAPTNPSAWLGTAGDLGTLKFDQAAFEEVYARGLGLARSRLGPDAELHLWTCQLLSSPNIWFRAISQGASKVASMHVYPETEQFYGVERIGAGTWLVNTADATPWRTDPTWVQLVAQSWQRERPFGGTVFLRRAGRDDSGFHWAISYRREVDGVSESPVDWKLVDGHLVRT